MIFVDTSAWFASIVPSDTNYLSASSWVNQNTQPLLTTDYIVDETLTLLRSRGEAHRAIRLGEAFFSDYRHFKLRQNPTLNDKFPRSLI